MQNFGNNVQIATDRLHSPRSEQQVLELMRQYRGSRIRVIGRLHSWSQLIDHQDLMLDLRHLDSVNLLRTAQSPSVQVGAGCQIKHLILELNTRAGWTLPSLGLISEQSIAGAISTGTHGSGKHSLSHYVESVRVARYSVAGEPEIVEIRDGSELRAARCSLGCLGVILSVTMTCREVYQIEEHFKEYDRVEAVLDLEQQFPLQQFFLVPWRWSYVAQHRREVQAPRSRSTWAYRLYRLLLIDILMHTVILAAIRWLRSNAITRWLFRRVIPDLVIRNWRVTDDSTRQLIMEHELFRHVEMELFVSRCKLPEALATVTRLLEDAAQYQVAAASIHEPDQPAPERRQPPHGRPYVHHYPICVRRILYDDTLISMASRPATADHASDSAMYSISLISYSRGRDRQRFQELCRSIALKLADTCQARPHWGKLNPLPLAQLKELYPQFEEFRECCRQADPDGRFLNDWTDGLLQIRQSSAVPQG